MNRRTALPVLLLLGLSGQVAWSQTVTSPDGRLTLTVSTDAAGRLNYSAKRDDHDLVFPSRLGPILDGRDRGYGAKTAAKGPAKSGHDAFGVSGVHDKADVRFTEQSFAVRHPAGDWTLDVRVYDDAVAFRYRVPGQGTRHVTGEATEFRIRSGGRFFYQSFTLSKDYEGRYRADGTGSVIPGDTIAAPALMRFPDDLGYALVTEANLINYTDMALTCVSDSSFRAIFHNDAGGFELNGDVTTPWRVVVLAEDLTKLVNTDVLRSLCPPPEKELADADWIKPGRSTWHWRVTFHPKFEVQHQWVDYSAALGFEYYLVDDGWRDWKEDGRDAWAMLKSVVDYARTKNVRVIAWAHSNELNTPEKRTEYMRKAHEIGLAGLKIDFMRPANVEWVQWYDDTLREAAKFHLVLDYHGALKPTGRDRTWPNELTREGVSGREQGKLPGAHDTIVPFVRNVQGNCDYTPFEMRPRELGGNTVAKELAQAVVYTSPLLCYSGDPKDYLASPALDVIKTIPATWDQTIVLPGSQVAEVAAYARRKGDAWYVGVVNGSDARTLKLPLSFLGDGKYQAVLLGDSGKPEAFDRQDKTLTKADTIDAKLASDGGLVVRFEPVAK